MCKPTWKDVSEQGSLQTWLLHKFCKEEWVKILAIFKKLVEGECLNQAIGFERVIKNITTLFCHSENFNYCFFFLIPLLVEISHDYA